MSCADLDRSNLGNARLQGLPEDTLGGDPTGELFDMINSVFFITYVRATNMATSTATHFDPLAPVDCFPNPCNCHFKALPTPDVDGRLRYWLGIVLNPHGKHETRTG
jgi:hypothetical protein